MELGEGPEPSELQLEVQMLRDQLKEMTSSFYRDRQLWVKEKAALQQQQQAAEHHRRTQSVCSEGGAPGGTCSGSNSDAASAASTDIGESMAGGGGGGGSSISGSHARTCSFTSAVTMSRGASGAGARGRAGGRA